MVCVGDGQSVSITPDASHLTPPTEGFGLDADSDGSYPYTYGEGLNFTMNLDINTVDFGTLHLYPDSCKSSLCSWVVDSIFLC